MNEQESDSDKPFLELSDHIPKDCQFLPTDSEENKPLSPQSESEAKSLLDPSHPLLYQPRSQPRAQPQQPSQASIPNQSRNWRSALNQMLAGVPRWALVALLVSMVVILALMPEFLLITVGVLEETVLLLRVLALPLAALFLTLWLIRLFYPQNRR